MTPSTITNKHSSSTKALHVAQSTSFSSRTTLPIKMRKKKQNYLFCYNVDYSLVYISWNSMVQVGMAQFWAGVFDIKDRPRKFSITVKIFIWTFFQILFRWLWIQTWVTWWDRVHLFFFTISFYLTSFLRLWACHTNLNHTVPLL